MRIYYICWQKPMYFTFLYFNHLFVAVSTTILLLSPTQALAERLSFMHHERNLTNSVSYLNLYFI